MSDETKLREAMKEWNNCPVHFTWEDVIYRAAKERLAQLELDAIVIERDGEGEWPGWLTEPDGPVWRQCGGTEGLLDDIYEAIVGRQ